MTEYFLHSAENVYLDASLRLRIELVVKRLTNSVQQVDIVNWLGNFKQSEFERAISILECLEYVTEHELIEHLNDRLDKLIEDFGEDRSYLFHAIGDYGKSGTLLTYFLKKAPSFRRIKAKTIFLQKNSELTFISENNTLPKDSILILLDDFLGSGKSLWKYFKNYIKPQSDSIKEITDVCVLTVYHLQKAANLISGLMPGTKLFSELKYACFQNGKSPFGSRSKIRAHRDLSYYYGKHLFSVARGKALEYHPLGYNNSQALIVFPYNPPNNTLPIIWSSRFVKEWKRQWVPLYPRNQQVKISQAKAIRKELAYELGLLKMGHPLFFDVLYTGRHVGQTDWQSYSYIKSTDFRLFAYIRLKQQNRLDAIICDILGITSTDLEEILFDGKERGVFNDVNELSEYGKSVYLNCLKILKRVKKQVGKNGISYELNQIHYLPKTFNGEER